MPPFDDGKKCCLWIILSAFLCTSLSAFAGAPTVASVTAEQQSTGEVIISYNLADPENDPCRVTVEIVDPQGNIFRPQLLTGDFGPGIAPGSGKQIIWDAMQDIPGRFGTTWQARVFAMDESEPGNEMQIPLPGSELSLTFVRVPAGEFIMGSSDGSDNELPVHSVYLDEYWIMKYPVTVEQWRAYAQAKGLSMPVISGSAYPDYMSDSRYNNYPVICVNWYEVQAFADWIGGVALPTEAQWEKAARGTDGRTYPWGEELPDEGEVYRANLGGASDGYQYTSAVGAYEIGASPYGVMDMTGNVWEWCRDWFGEEYYSQTPTEGWHNPEGPMSGESRCLRGAGWGNNDYHARSAKRFSFKPEYPFNYLGFRLVLTQ